MLNRNGFLHLDIQKTRNPQILTVVLDLIWI
jgi:hypothetical protein